MRIMLCASACLLSLFVAACDGDASGGGGGGGSGGAGTTSSDSTSSSMAGSGGTGGSTSTGGSGGATTSSSSSSSTAGGTGGAGGTTTSSGAAFGEPCTMDTDCQDGLLCYNFNAKGMLCTHACQSDQDCAPPSSGCNGMGYCKPN